MIGRGRYSAERRLFEISARSAETFAVLIEAYMDESGTGSDDAVHCLAGYLVKPDQATAMSLEWQDVLDQHDLPFFHMTDCASYEVCEPYKSLGREKCIGLATNLIEIIKDYCFYGFAVCFSPKFYAVYEDPTYKTTDPYGFSVAFVNGVIQSGIEKIKYPGNVAYFFEAGHAHQRFGREVLDRLVGSNDKTNVSSYSFQKKQDAILLQAADILAWHCNTYIKRKMKGLPIRKDFQSMLQIPHDIWHLTNAYKDGVRDTRMTALVPDMQASADTPGMTRKIQGIYLLGTGVD